MLMKPPGAGHPPGELGHVYIAVAVDLGRAQIGDVDAATVIAVENLGVLDNGLHVGGGAAAVAGGWHAAQCARLDGQGHLAGHPSSPATEATPSGMPKPRFTRHSLRSSMAPVGR